MFWQCTNAGQLRSEMSGVLQVATAAAMCSGCAGGGLGGMATWIGAWIAEGVVTSKHPAHSNLPTFALAPPVCVDLAGVACLLTALGSDSFRTANTA